MDSDFEDEIYGPDELEEEGEEEDETPTTDDRAQVTSDHTAQGTDLQAIPWNSNRHSYRISRIESYDNYRNLDVPLDSIAKEATSVKKDGRYYRFKNNYRVIRCSICHFQLRNLLWTTGKNDIFYMLDHKILHFCPISHQITTVFDLSMKRPQHQKLQVSAMNVQDHLLVIGGFAGEVVAKNIETNTIMFSERITREVENSITNALELFRTSGNSFNLISSNNDCAVRIFDLPTFQIRDKFTFDWCVNHTTPSPDGKLYCVVGDNEEILIIDSQNGQPQFHLKGHLDYSFASAWLPNCSHIVATGNQDKTTRVWDLRYPKQSLHILQAQLGSVLSLRFTNQFLAASECADFVTLYDVGADFSRCQEIEFFGEISGISFTPDQETLFVGNADRMYGGLLELEACRSTTMQSFLYSYI